MMVKRADKTRFPSIGIAVGWNKTAMGKMMHVFTCTYIVLIRHAFLPLGLQLDGIRLLWVR